eukprot:scaffold188825_cov19-Tisochrysis_lutea.AAC.2
MNGEKDGVLHLSKDPLHNPYDKAVGNGAGQAAKVIPASQALANGAAHPKGYPGPHHQRGGTNSASSNGVAGAAGSCGSSFADIPWDEHSYTAPLTSSCVSLPGAKYRPRRRAAGLTEVNGRGAGLPGGNDARARPPLTGAAPA